MLNSIKVWGHSVSILDQLTSTQNVDCRIRTGADREVKRCVQTLGKGNASNVKRQRRKRRRTINYVLVSYVS
jgi:hypothetical protein